MKSMEIEQIKGISPTVHKSDVAVFNVYSSCRSLVGLPRRHSDKKIYLPVQEIRI